MVAEAESVTLATDPAAFFREHYPKVYRFVAAATGASEAEVEDIAQETLLRAWKDRAQFRGDASPLTWVLSIARTRVLDFRRHRRRHDEVLRGLSQIETELVAADLLEDAELRGRVRTALDALPAEYSDVLLRKYQQGQSLREMAAELGESEAAVESRLRRAKDAFRLSLTEGTDDEP